MTLEEISQRLLQTINELTESNYQHLSEIDLRLEEIKKLEDELAQLYHMVEVFEEEIDRLMEEGGHHLEVDELQMAVEAVNEDILDLETEMEEIQGEIEEIRLLIV